MNNLLNELFGETISREEALGLICRDSSTESLYLTLSRKSQEDILSFISGTSSLSMLYDPFFDYAMSGEENIPHVTRLISDILGKDITITSTLPNTQNIVDKISYYSMNYEVLFDNGSKSDVEFHKMSVAPSNEMIECLAANNIIKQYNRLKEMKGFYFRFDLLRPNYIIIFTEKSRAACNKYFLPHSDADYIQSECNFIDSVNRVHGLTNIIIISLNDYTRCHQAKKTSLDAWMTFMKAYDQETALKLSTVFPHFKDIYKKVSHLRYDTSNLINMYIEGQKRRDLNTTVTSTAQTNVETLALRNAASELRKENKEKSHEIARLNRLIRNLKNGSGN